MKRKTREKLKKILAVIFIIIGLIVIGFAICFIKKTNKEEEISYEDGLVCKHLFKEITIDFSNQKVKRDGKKSNLKEEFNITEEMESILFSSEGEMQNFLANSVFEISYDNNIFKIQNPYQRKCIIVKADKIKDKVEGEDILEIYPNIYMINFKTEKITKLMYNYYKEQSYIEKIYLDEIYIDDPINDISQTVYGDTESDLNGYHTIIVSKVGMDNYKKIILENGNPQEVIVATIGYGIDYENKIFNDRITQKCYNFMLNNNNIKETIPQGSRIAEVIVDSTTNNVKILPLVTVTEEGYTSLSAIIKSIYVATNNSDVICFEITNPQNEFIDLVIEEAYKANIPFCTVGSSKKENYPASSQYTLVASSLDKELEISDYSGRGNYIDFAIPSTDVEEIFNQWSSVSRWSGSHYSNAELASIIALIKTYNKDATIKEIYNFIKNYAIDLGEEGKDDLYGYGVPNFSNLKISDIDKSIPIFKEVKYSNKTWERIKKVKVVMEDNIRIKSWALTKNESEPNIDEWKKIDNITHKIESELEITENGNYYLFVEDTAGNRAKQSINIQKVDNISPSITYNIDKETLSEGYVTINIGADDNESGLEDNPYSFDKINWANENNKKIVKENGRYKAYARDKLGNLKEVEIIIDCFPEEGTAEIGEGNILQSIFVSADWDGNINNNVQITLNNNLNISAWQITTENSIPNNFMEIRSQTRSNEEQNRVDTYIEENTINTNTNTNSNNITLNTTNNNSNSNTIDVNAINLNNIVTITDRSASKKNNISSRANQNIRENYITLKVSLEVDKLYYLWVKDYSGNYNYQTLKIHKKQI